MNVFSETPPEGRITKYLFSVRKDGSDYYGDIPERYVGKGLTVTELAKRVLKLKSADQEKLNPNPDTVVQNKKKKELSVADVVEVLIPNTVTIVEV